MNRLEIETNLIESLHELPSDKLMELFDFASFLKSHLILITPTKKPNFVDFIRNSPLYGAELELERDQTLCRNIDL
jgi:hypothetical protein